MKIISVIVALMLNSYSYSQANNHISIDKLSFTLTNFEISGDFRSIPTMNWKTNLTISGFEMQIDERAFQEFSRQINNDDKIVIDQFKAIVSNNNNPACLTVLSGFGSGADFDLKPPLPWSRPLPMSGWKSSPRPIRSTLLHWWSWTWWYPTRGRMIPRALWSATSCRPA